MRLFKRFSGTIMGQKVTPIERCTLMQARIYAQFLVEPTYTNTHPHPPPLKLPSVPGAEYMKVCVQTLIRYMLVHAPY